MKPRDYFIMAGAALILLLMSIAGLVTNLNALAESKSAAVEAKKAVEISTTNTKKLDRNYQRWDDFARENPDIKVPDPNGEKR